MKIAFFSAQSYDINSFEKYNQGNELKFFATQLNSNTVGLANGFEAVCAFVNDRLDKQVLTQLSTQGINCVLLRCAGFNNVDLETAKELGIDIYRVPAYSPNSVAEHAVALIQTLNRKTHKAYNRVREGNFSLQKLEGFDIFRKNVGVIGTGKIGTAFVKIMLGFGANVLAFDINPSEELKNLGVKYVNLDELFSESDIISIHCPLNEHTNHLIDENSIAKMKNGVMIINTSRGAIIKTKDIIYALKKGHIGYLGLDVYEQEEHIFFKDLSETIISDDDIARLTTFPNVLITGHQGFFTNEALAEIALTSLKNAKDHANQVESKNCLTL